MNTFWSYFRDGLLILGALCTFSAIIIAVGLLAQFVGPWTLFISIPLAVIATAAMAAAIGTIR